MKKASGIAAVILGVLSFFNIAGCIKAEHDYSQFESYSNSSVGEVEGFVRGLRSGSQGDPFGAALDIVSQGRTLSEDASSSSFWAWTCTIATVISSIVYSRAPAMAKAPQSSEPISPKPNPEPRATETQAIVPPPPPPLPQNPDIYLHYEDKQHGPFTIGQIYLFQQNGSIPIDALYWRDGFSDWKSIAELSTE
jgi:hypothetical protein